MIMSYNSKWKLMPAAIGLILVILITVLEPLVRCHFRSNLYKWEAFPFLVIRANKIKINNKS